jgi:alanyl-tRNA synthetase
VPDPTAPATQKLYLDDPYLLEFDARVLARIEHQGRPAIVLDRTAFYAEGGGQPWDTGLLNGVPVLAVLQEGDQVLHLLATPIDHDAVHGVVDGRRRRDHMQQHHGQHLLSRAFVEAASARTVGFHLGTDEVTIDLDREVGPRQAFDAEARANAAVQAALPVSCLVTTAGDARSRGVEPPADAGDEVRLVEARGFDLQPCGGTHPRNTAEVGVVAVLGVERYKGGTRVRFVCGRRALEALHRRDEMLARIGSLLSVPLEATPDAVERLRLQCAASERRADALLGRTLQAEARALFDRGRRDGGSALVVERFEGWPTSDLRILAQNLIALGPCVALLGSADDGKAHVVFAQSDGLPHDVPALLREAAAALGGRGGGRGNVVQGGGDRVAALPEALEQAARRVRGL